MIYAVPVNDFEVVPDAVSLADAATLPVAGLTALYGLERGQRLLGSNVLITGASGVVGYFACQLARAMGSHACCSFSPTAGSRPWSVTARIGVESERSRRR